MGVDIKVTIPTTTNVITVRPANLVASTTGGSRGDTDLESAITVTNTDGAFTHLTSFAAGTSLESVLRQILEKYNRTTIALTRLYYRLESTTSGVFGGQLNTSGNLFLEVGRAFKLEEITYSIADNTQTTDDSVKLIQGSNTELVTGLADTGGQVDITDQTFEGNSTGTTSLKVTAIDDGGDGLEDETISSSTKSITWRYRVRVGGSSTATVADASAAQTLFDGVTTATDSLLPATPFIVTTNSAMDTQGNYTWIMYPASFGNISSIVVNGAQAVLTDFEDPFDFDITNAYGHTASYRFYRSTDDDAFADGTGSTPVQKLTISF